MAWPLPLAHTGTERLTSLTRSHISLSSRRDATGYSHGRYCYGHGFTRCHGHPCPYPLLPASLHPLSRGHRSRLLSGPQISAWSFPVRAFLMEEQASPSPSLALKAPSAGLTLSDKGQTQSDLLIFALAGISNMCGAAVTNPVNVIKVRMQLDGALASSHQGRRYRRMFPGILQIARDEGVSGLWKGTGAALMREASYSSIRMGAYEPLKKVLGGENPAHTPLWVKLTAGAFAGIIGSAIANPTDVVMIRMQAPSMGIGSQQWAYKGPMHALGSIAKTEGLRGLYRGVWPTMQRAGLLTAVQIASYDHTKHALLNSGWMEEGVLCHLSSSMTAGLMTAIAIAPVDLVKTRIMQQAIQADGNGTLYNSTVECFWKTLKSEGPQGLYKGFIPVWMRIGPHTIITFFVFEQLRKSLGLRPV